MSINLLVNEGRLAVLSPLQLNFRAHILRNSPKYMPQISVCLYWQEGNYIIKLFTKLISVDTKLLRQCCDRMRYVLKHNDKKIVFLCCYAYALTVRLC